MSSLLQSKTARGTVGRKNSRTVWVTITTACDTARTCKAGCGSCGGSVREQKIMIELPDTTSFSPGDTVTVHFHAWNEFIAALIVFGIPLGCALISIAVWYFFSPSTVESGYAILAAGASFAAGFLLVKAIDHSFRAAYPASIEKSTPINPDASPHLSKSTAYG